MKTVYTCNKCDHQTPKWVGKCPECDNWNTMVEEVAAPTPKKGSRAAWLPPSKSKAALINDVTEISEDRTPCGLREFDRVLGGGIVPGSLILIGGEPGAGKSTLLLQTVAHLSQTEKVLYITGEESAHQIKMRAKRLKVKAKSLYLLAENSLEVILQRVSEVQPKFLVIDSIQTIYTGNLESAPGSVSQVKECATRLMYLAKQEDISTFLIGHVTKEGGIAGPRTVEHQIDVLLLIEGDPGHNFRILRSVKNRFGSTNEIGVFEMRGDGLAEVPNPSEVFLAERPLGEAGSVVVPSIEGTRPILVEVQALVSSSNLGTPRRTTLGFDSNRTSLLCAVLEKKVGMSLAGLDVYLNVAGGIKLIEPAVDLAVLAALASSHLNRPVPEKTILFGEVGLAGEVRAVPHAETRVKEAARLGFEKIIMPHGNVKNLKRPKGIEIFGVKSAAEALELL